MFHRIIQLAVLLHWHGVPHPTEPKVIIQADPDHSDADKGVKKSILFAEQGVSRRKENGKAVSNQL